MGTALIILGAGMGTRMKSDLPKVLHQIAGAPMKTVVVAGHGAAQVEAAARDWDPDVQTVLQNEQLGTAHAVAQAKDGLADFAGDALVLYGDTPFIQMPLIRAAMAVW